MRVFILATLLCATTVLAATFEVSERSARTLRTKDNVPLPTGKKITPTRDSTDLEDVAERVGQRALQSIYEEDGDADWAAEDDLEFTVHKKRKLRRRTQRKKRSKAKKVKQKLQGLKKKAQNTGKKIKKGLKNAKKGVEKKPKNAAKRAKNAAKRAAKKVRGKKKKPKRKVKNVAKRGPKKRGAGKKKRSGKRSTAGRRRRRRGKRNPGNRSKPKKRRRRRPTRKPRSPSTRPPRTLTLKVPPKLPRKYPPTRPPATTTRRGPKLCRCHMVSKQAKECYSFTDESKGRCKLRFCDAKWECLTNGRSRHLCIEKFARDTIEPYPDSSTKCRRVHHPPKSFWVFYRTIPKPTLPAY